MKSIRLRLILYLVAGVTLLQIAAGAGLFVYVRKTLEHSLDAALLAKADAIANAVHMEDDGKPHLQSDAAGFSEFAHHDGLFYFQIWQSNGNTLTRSLPPEHQSADLPKISASHRQFANMVLPGGATARATQRDFFAQPDEDQYDPGHRQPIPRGEEMVLVVAHDRRSIDQTLTVLLTGLGLTISLVTAGIFAIVTWGVRQGLRPLHLLEIEMGRIGPGTLDLRCTTTNLPSETLPIATKLNALLDRLEEGFERERRFSADLAHELRTPLAELRSVCEVALKWPDNASNAAAVEDALLITREMEGTVTALLSLVRAQAGLQKPQKDDVNVCELLSSAWAPLEETAIGKQLRVDQRINPLDNVMTDRGMFSQVIRNVFANAVQHAPVGGQLRIESSSFEEKIAVSIGNTNASLEAADIPHLCESFWRKDSARTDSLSVGLGLAIAKEYCDQLGISLELKLDKLAWFSATLEFPSHMRIPKTAPPINRC